MSFHEHRQLTDFDEGMHIYSRCAITVTMGNSSFTLKSNGIPDHNACAAPPRSTVQGIDICDSLF